MVGESKKMKISISLETDDFEILRKLVETRKAASLSHAVRLCIMGYGNFEKHRLEKEVGE